jgi:hypothetical protein
MTTIRARNAAECPSILFIVPYFGELPRYAHLFFRSCAANPTVNWLLITDQEIDPNQLPQNVTLRKTTFAALKMSIDATLGFETTLPTPYKLNDFRPAFAVMFPDEIRGFDFWGHCDIDVILGDIRAFLTPAILQAYKKVLIHGHLSLYRNCEEANHYFELRTPDINFRDVFTSPKAWAFDEFGGMRRLLKHHNIPLFRDDNYFADIDRHVYKLQTIQPPHYRHQCFYWEEGKVFRMFWDGSQCGKQEYLYIHLARRPMGEPPSDLQQGNRPFYIMPREFVSKDSEPSTPSELDRLNPSNVLFDATVRALSSLWHVKNAIMQKVDSWPRRA